MEPSRREEGWMEYVHLGRLGLKVSPLCLGTMNFGPETSEQDSFAIMDRAIDLGINFFDTANVYGRSKGVGATETIVGKWFAQGGGRREKVVVATKVYGEMGKWPNDSRLSARHIRDACEGSLRRLQTDHIDIYQMHHVYRPATWDEIWQAFETLEGGRRSRGSVQEDLDKHRDRIEAYEKLCAVLGERPADVALAWLLANPVVTAPILGPRTMEQLDGSMRALELRLDDKTMRRLDQIFPGPGGPAPEAYAW